MKKRAWKPRPGTSHTACPMSFSHKSPSMPALGRLGGSFPKNLDNRGRNIGFHKQGEWSKGISQILLRTGRISSSVGTSGVPPTSGVQRFPTV
jgi:hypothetical protein